MVGTQGTQEVTKDSTVSCCMWHLVELINEFQAVQYVFGAALSESCRTHRQWYFEHQIILVSEVTQCLILIWSSSLSAHGRRQNVSHTLCP